MKGLRNVVVFLCVAWLTACSSSPYIEQARAQAQESAKNLIDNITDDELKMQQLILEAKAQQSEYYLLGDTVAANEYDSAFRQYIVEHNDSLAKILF